MKKEIQLLPLLEFVILKSFKTSKLQIGVGSDIYSIFHCFFILLICVFGADSGSRGKKHPIRESRHVRCVSFSAHN